MLREVNKEIFVHIQSFAEWKKTSPFKVGFEGTAGVDQGFNPYYRYLHENQEPGMYDMGIGLKMLREYVFEDIRSKLFPELPSRQTCLWVVPMKKAEDIIYWKTQLDVDRQFILLELTGKVFSTDESHLHIRPENFRNIKELEGKAKDYWGAEPGDSVEENLFEGKFKVLEILSETGDIVQK
ncbi:DUF2441 domain-containing protein [Cytobacillus oceanisediminis]|uniref:DUF2441 domain-containing protein n=1 Tax=Cytobacillus oceanisediminis 2691 TaxID=1196031 RepID=A0A161J2K4_9BACI|nr:DUF2441 domain-containing protein [Cytobacillus oceanisediminis]AND39635.1 hypothetical protein A361_10960 [Cytobacillus oceanisediminis 2691]